MSPPDEKSFHTIDEVRAALRALTLEEWTRLKRRSRQIAGDRVWAEDLRQMAFVRALEGRRRWRRGDGLVNFLINTMRSIMSARREAEEAREAEGFDELPMPEGDIPAVLSGEADDDTRPGVEQIQADIVDDPALVQLVGAVLTGAKGARLEQMLGCDAQGVNTLRRRLKRRCTAMHKEALP